MLSRFMLLAFLLCTATGAYDVDETPEDRIADSPLPDATLTLTGGVVAFGIGYAWGHGTLSYQGQTLTVRVHGISLGDLGTARINAHGVVYKLSCLDDFAGRYVAVSAGAAIARGESAAFLQNKHGVVIELESKITGVRFTLAATRLWITLGAHESCTGPLASTR